MSQIAVSHRARRAALDVPGGPVAVLDTGPPASSAARPVLFVPGYTGSKEDFLPLLDPVAGTGRRAVAMDQRGQYESPGPEDPAAYTVDRLAADARAVAAGLGPPVHLVGHSFGGLVARAAAIADPGLVASLVLLCSGPAALGGPRTNRIALLEPLLAQGGMAAVYEGLQEFAAGHPAVRDGPPELRAFLRRRFVASSPVGLRAMSEALTTEPDRVAALRATAVPVLVAHGADDDAWTPRAQAEMARRLGARHAVIPGSAHSPAVENTPATLRALLGFWGEVDSGAAAVPPSR